MQVRFFYSPSTHSVAHGVHSPVMDRLREVNVRTLLNTRIDLNSLKTPPATPYACGTPTSESTGTPCLSPASSTPELSESPCPTPPPASPRLPSFVFPPPVVQSESSCATIKTTDGIEINADLIVRPLPFSPIPDPYVLCSSYVRARPIIPRFWRCYHPNRLTTGTGRRRTSCDLSSLELGQTTEGSSFLNIHTSLSSGMRPMPLEP